jgi:hypothetical protein
MTPDPVFIAGEGDTADHVRVVATAAGIRIDVRCDGQSSVGDGLVVPWADILKHLPPPPRPVHATATCPASYEFRGDGC